MLALAVEAGGFVGEAQLESRSCCEFGLAAAFAVLGFDEVEEEDAGADRMPASATVSGAGRRRRRPLWMGRCTGGEQAREGEEAGAGDEPGGDAGRTETTRMDSAPAAASSRAGPVYGGRPGGMHGVAEAAS